MKIRLFMHDLTRRLLGSGDEDKTLQVLPAYDLLVEKARQEMQAALCLFNHVVEKDLIDHAIYKLNAAERRYIFLLQEARQQETPGQALDFTRVIQKGGNPSRELT